MSFLDNEFNELYNCLTCIKNVKFDTFKIIVIGQHNSGKSSIVRRMLNLNIAAVTEGTTTRCQTEYRIESDNSEDAKHGEFTIVASGFPSTGKQLSRNATKISHIDAAKFCNEFSVDFFNYCKRENLEKEANSKFLKGRIIFSIKCKGWAPITVVDLPGIISWNSSEKHALDIDAKISSEITEQVLRDSENALIVCVIESTYYKAGLSIPNCLRDVLGHEQPFQRVVGVVTKADSSDAALTRFPNYISNSVVKVEHGFYGIVNPSWESQLQSLQLASHPKIQRIYQDSATTLQSDCAIWDFNKADNAELEFWEFAKDILNEFQVSIPSDFDARVGMYNFMETIRSSFENQVRKNLKSLQQAIPKERQQRYLKLKSFPFVLEEHKSLCPLLDKSFANETVAKREFVKECRREMNNAITAYLASPTLKVNSSNGTTSSTPNYHFICKEIVDQITKNLNLKNITINNAKIFDFVSQQAEFLIELKTKLQALFGELCKDIDTKCKQLNQLTGMKTGEEIYEAGIRVYLGKYWSEIQEQLVNTESIKLTFSEEKQKEYVETIKLIQEYDKHLQVLDELLRRIPNK